MPALEGNKFRVDPADVKKAVSQKTKLIILNTPSNPTGAILDRNTLSQISAIAQRDHIFVLSDEPYEHILFDGRKHFSIASIDGMQPLTVSAFTLSKPCAMTGRCVGSMPPPTPTCHQSFSLLQ